ncbi:MAG TPA: lipocalin-like domain-containing protein [Hanamia sp.]
MKGKLINTWVLVSFEIMTNNGETIYPFGKVAKGMLIYTLSGNFSVQIMKNDGPLFKSDDPMTGSSEESEAGTKGVISYFGHYTFDESENIVEYHVEESLFPNWKGLTMKRFAQYKDNLLVLNTEPTAWEGGKVIGTSIWKQR